MLKCGLPTARSTRSGCFFADRGDSQAWGVVVDLPPAASIAPVDDSASLVIRVPKQNVRAVDVLCPAPLRTGKGQAAPGEYAVASRANPSAELCPPAVAGNTYPSSIRSRT